MAPENRERADQILREAVGLSPDDRDAFLAERCAGDAELRRSVERRLRDRVRKELGAGFSDLLPEDRRQPEPELSPEESTTTDAPPRETIPVRIGPYRILQRIGAGGMGAVYAAEQEEPIRRRVALKVIKRGMDTEQVLARFEAERQALALMDHPNIAKVFDAGETEHGLPYFVMELVKGEPITTFCDRHRLPIRKRLELFIPVCHAVQHAHHKGVIHRDLKPSNILVAVSDDASIPKVIDFGVAKATAAALTEKTLFTAQGQLIGTPAYMSPEQAEMGGLDVDTRTDVYSLGVLLYELLTGALPFDVETLRRAALARIQEIIRHEEPKRPSTKVSTLGARSRDAAHARSTDAARLSRQLRGDLDWIVLRAMAKDRTRRYETANGLALDVGRHLRDEPVLAGPPSAAYRMGKFAKRHRVALAFVAVVVASLSYVGFESNRQRVAAQRARDESEAVTDFLSQMLGAVEPEKKGKDVTVREVLDEAAKTIGEKYEAQPLVRARLMMTMGNVYRSLGHYAEARPLLEGALAIREKELGPEHLDVARSLNNLARLLFEIGDYAGARLLYERSIAIREKAVGPEHLDLVPSLNNLAVLLWKTGDYEGARPLQERVLAIREKALGPDHPDVAGALNNLAILLWQTGDYAGARPLYERALAIQEKEFGPDHLKVAEGLGNLAVLLFDTGDFAAARPLQERALAIQEKALGPDHPNVATTLGNVADLRRQEGDYAGARPLYERALAIRERAFGVDHPDVAGDLHNLANLLTDTGDYAQARAYYERALAIREKAFGADHADVASSLNGLADLLRKTGDYTEARSLYERALAIREQALGTDHPLVAETLEGLSVVLRSQGETAKAEQFEARVQAIHAKHPANAGS